MWKITSSVLLRDELHYHLHKELYQAGKKIVKKHPELFCHYEKVLKLLELNPYHSSLRLHRLSGNLKDLYSVSINISYRITMEFFISEKTIVPVNIEPHDQVY